VKIKKEKQLGKLLQSKFFTLTVFCGSNLQSTISVVINSWVVMTKQFVSAFANLSFISHIYIISWVLKTNVYAHFLLNSCLKSLEKTCQVHFFKVEPRLKNLSYAFCSIFVILSAKNYLYQTISEVKV